MRLQRYLLLEMVFSFRSVKSGYKEENWGNQFNWELAVQLSSAREAVKRGRYSPVWLRTVKSGCEEKVELQECTSEMETLCVLQLQWDWLDYIAVFFRRPAKRRDSTLIWLYHFLPNPFQFISHQSYYNSTVWGTSGCCWKHTKNETLQLTP
jgi:hypothetical protein